MEFDRDAANRNHIARHGISTEECEQAYTNGPLVIEHQMREGEKGRLCLGETPAGRLPTFVVTERSGKIRFITAHPMHKRQREFYREEK